MDRRPLVYLLRAPDHGASARDRFEAALEGVGFEVVSVPVLRFEPAGEEPLRQALLHPNDYHGLILTSPRAAFRLVDTLSRYQIDPKPWRQRPVFAVGPATTLPLRNAGFTPLGEDCGNAGELAELVRQIETRLPWLFLCGDRRRDTLPETLRAAGILRVECVVYRSIDRSPVWDQYAVPDWAVLFSPAGARNALPAWPKSWQHVRLATIGQTTADALAALGFVADAVAEEPTPAGLVRSLTRAGFKG